MCTRCSIRGSFGPRKWLPVLILPRQALGSLARMPCELEEEHHRDERVLPHTVIGRNDISGDCLFCTS